MKFLCHCHSLQRTFQSSPSIFKLQYRFAFCLPSQKLRCGRNAAHPCFLYELKAVLTNLCWNANETRLDIVPAAFIAIILPPSQGQVPPNLKHSKGLLPKDFSLHFVLSVTLSSLNKSFALRHLTILFSSGPKNMVKKMRKMMVADEVPCGRNLLGLFLNLSNGLPDF